MRYGVLHALGAAAYIMGVAFIMMNLPRVEGEDHVIAVAFFLTMFVISAAVMAMIVFARPVMWFLNGEKTAAVQLVLATIISLACIALIFLSINLFLYAPRT